MTMQTESVVRLQKELEKGSALLVASVPGRFYLTGFETSDGYVLITPENAYFLIDFRYYEKAKELVKSCDVLLSNAALRQVSELCEENGISNLFVESESVSLSFFNSLKEAVSPVSVSDDGRFDSLLRGMRSVKTQRELELIREAQKLTDDTFSYILEIISRGIS